MTEDQTRSLISALILVGFYSLVVIVLLGFVNIESPEVAKMVGLFSGYGMSMLNPIIQRYFKNKHNE